MTASLISIVVALILSVSAMILLNRFIQLHPFFGLLAASIIFGVVIGKPMAEIMNAMQNGFGSLLQHIGFIVALGSCLGMVLEKTGAMEIISRKLITFFGSKRSSLAMTVIGAVVGIPVFCDSGFIILSRLIPSIAARASLPGSTLALSLASGLYTTHTLVPPTPGPLAAAVNLGLSDHLGEMILIGIMGSIPVILVANFFAGRMGARIVLKHTQQESVQLRDLPAWRAFLPLVLPILLITLSTLVNLLNLTGWLRDFMITTGDPVIALLIGLILSFTLIPQTDKKNWPGWISEALKDAGTILLIVGAGGAFGYVIRESGIDQILKSYITDLQAAGIIFLCIGFLIASILKTAQGSTTSSMIITSSLIAPLAVSAGFVTPVHSAILVLAIGGGAMTVSHANDAYFWVVTQFGGFHSRDTFRSYTPITLIQGITALIMAIILHYNMVNIIIAPDKFKGSLTAHQVCEAVKEGLLLHNKPYEIKSYPLADGGEGTAELLTKYSAGKWVKVQVKDPLFRKIQTEYGISGDGATAFVEMAKASGLGLLQEAERNPLVTTTYGTGELILDAIERGVKKIVLGIGGSATNDAGIGMAAALGFGFLDQSGNVLDPVGKNLIHIEALKFNSPSERLKAIEFIILSDVTNPLYGANGAAYVYGPQKGADHEAIELLDNGLRHFAEIMKKYFKRPPDFPGAGAAGGMGAGSRIFLNGTLVTGVTYIMETVGLDKKIQHADLVITGEGKLDQQSLSGKVVGEVCRMAQRLGKSTLVICGQCELSPEEANRSGIKKIISLAEGNVTIEDAIRNADTLIKNKVAASAPFIG